MSCIICNQPSDNSVCYKDSCILQFDCSYQTGDKVVYEYIQKKRGKKELLFILTTMKKGITQYGINDLFIKQTENNEDLSYPVLENFSNVKNNTADFNTIKRMITEISYEDRDFENVDDRIISHVHRETYGMIKFALKKANMNLTFDKHTSEAVNIPGVYKLDNESLDQEAEFKNSTYLYHGSASHNWFSIIYNGLQIFSGTKRMTNGKAHGDGVYLSNDISMSSQYSGESSIFSSSATKKYKSDFILGVFEVNNATKYMKTTNIFVVNNKKDIRLKYIVNMASIPAKDVRSLSTYLTDSKKKIETSVKSYISTMKNKRLLMEYSRIQKKQSEVSVEKLDYEVLETEDLTAWTVKLLNVDSDSKLFADMKAMEVDAVYMSVKFTERYPIIPPTIRVIKPGFVPLTGHVTAGGAICFELLTNQGWSPAINMDNLFINIKAIISEDGRIQKKIDNTYTETNSKAGRDRFMKAHNWS